MFVEKDGEPEPEPVPENEPANDNDPHEPAEEERSFSTKQLSPVISSLKSAIVALEALGVKAEEPEGDGEAAEPTEEEKSFEDFRSKKKLLQDAATMLGEVLAEVRQARAAR